MITNYTSLAKFCAIDMMLLALLLQDSLEFRTGNSLCARSDYRYELGMHLNTFSIGSIIFLTISPSLTLRFVSAE